MVQWDARPLCWILPGVGLAQAASGEIMILVGRGRAAARRQVLMAPVALPGGGGVVLGD